VDDGEDVLGEESETTYLKFKISHFDLSLRANGKAELYFHSYFWTTYLTNLLTVCGLDMNELDKMP